MNRKRLILIFVNQELSQYHATFTLARELIKRGHRVVYIGNYEWAGYVKSQGFEYKLLELDKDFLEDMKNRHEKEILKAGKLKRLRLRIRMQNQMEKQIIEHQFDILGKWLATNTPDLALIGQGWATHFSILLLKKHIPILGLDTNLATSFRLKTPPTFSGIIPKSKIEWIGYIRIFLAWSHIYGKHFLFEFLRFARLLYGFGIFSYKKAYSISKDIKKYGGKIQWWEYGTCRLKVPGIVLCPLEFDFPSVTETSKRFYAGTGVCAKRLQMPLDWRAVDKTKPLIYCSIGSHPNYSKERVRLFRAVIESLKARPHLQGIIQVWHKEDIDSLNSLPGNVNIVASAPQVEVLMRAHLFITHGGLSSIRESVFYGVPMIAFPWGVDQPGNSARVVYHHLGLRGDIRKVTGENLGGLIDKIFNDSSYRQSVKQMQKIFKEQENCEKGIDLIESEFMLPIAIEETGREQQVKSHVDVEERIVIRI